MNSPICQVKNDLKSGYIQRTDPAAGSKMWCLFPCCDLVELSFLTWQYRQFIIIFLVTIQPQIHADSFKYKEITDIIFRRACFKTFQFVQCQGRRPNFKSALTTGIHWVFRGLKFEPDVEIGQNGTFWNWLMIIIDYIVIISEIDRN